MVDSVNILKFPVPCPAMVPHGHLRATCGRRSWVGVCRHHEHGCGFIVAACREHGGVTAALAELREHERECLWATRPAGMPVERVREAAEAGMSSQHLFVVVRQAARGRWTAALGLGSHTIQLRGSRRTKEEAAELGRQVSGRLYRERLEQIERLRQGNLDWGQPVDRWRPRMLYPQPGQSAWEAYEATVGGRR